MSHPADALAGRFEHGIVGARIPRARQEVPRVARLLKWSVGGPLLVAVLVTLVSWLAYTLIGVTLGGVLPGLGGPSLLWTLMCWAVALLSWFHVTSTDLTLEPHTLTLTDHGGVTSTTRIALKDIRAVHQVDDSLRIVLPTRDVFIPLKLVPAESADWLVQTLSSTVDAAHERDGEPDPALQTLRERPRQTEG